MKITNGAYCTSLNKCRIILQKFSVPGENIPLLKSEYKKKVYDSGFFEICRKGTHLDIYNYALNKHLYDFMLRDGSLIQFDFNELRYCIIEHPLQSFITYKKFLLLNNETYEDVGDFWIEEYNQYISSMPVDYTRTILRYDFSPTQYKGFLHPLSHFHIGLCRSIRFPLYGCITPTMFLLFGLKHLFFDELYCLFESNKDFIKIYSSEKKLCKFNDVSSLSDMENSELFFN